MRGDQADSCNPESVKSNGTATTQVPEVAGVHSSHNPDQLCDSNQTAGRRGYEDWHWSDRAKSPLDWPGSRNHANERLLLSPKPRVTEKLVLCPGSDGTCSRTMALSLHLVASFPSNPGCPMLQKFSVGIWLLLCISDGYRHIQSTLLANV